MAELFLTVGVGLKWAGFVLSPLLLLPFATLVAPAIFASPSKTLIIAINRISDTAQSVAIWLAGFIVLTQILIIIGRYVFDWSASWATEIVIYSFAGLFLFAASSALKSDAHVRVDILREKMSVRQKAGIDIAGIYLFLIPICVLVLWSSISTSFINSWLRFEGSRESDGLPIYFLFRTFVPAFGVLLLLQALSEALKASLIIKEQNASKPAPATEVESI
jgi:TRAP-type mannitol/chloroaromatic compound transport system permease small subunit